MFSRRIGPDPLDILWHFALGYMPDYLRRSGPAAGWCRHSHRGVQFLDQLQMPSGQKRYVFSPRFELRFNQAFEQVVRACAAVHHPLHDGREGLTWITPELITGLLRLHAMGYAHSYEAWCDGRLAGGAFGIQLGGFLTMGSMYHDVANASKAAVGRAMYHLRDRGFRCIDIGIVPVHRVNFGASWLPRWKFEEELRGMLGQSVSITDDCPCRPIPWPLRLGLPAARVFRAAQRRWDRVFPG
jgi:leucyl/phenylalanyl-tRNA--protein transferase